MAARPGRPAGQPTQRAEPVNPDPYPGADHSGRHPAGSAIRSLALSINQSAAQERLMVPDRDRGTARTGLAAVTHPLAAGPVNPGPLVRAGQIRPARRQMP